MLRVQAWVDDNYEPPSERDLDGDADVEIELETDAHDLVPKKKAAKIPIRDAVKTIRQSGLTTRKTENVKVSLAYLSTESKSNIIKVSDSHSLNVNT